MLKLEQDKKTRIVAITIHKRERFFNNTLLLAFTIAICVHLVPFLIIKISKLNLNYPDLLKPAEVVADPHSSELIEQGVNAEVPDHTLRKKMYLKPILPPISLPELRNGSSFSSIKSYPWDGNDEAAFIEMETLPLLSLIKDIVPTVTLPKVEVTPSGPIAMMNILNTGKIDLSETITLPVGNIEETQITYEVLVENHSGKIIWFTSEKKALHKNLIKHSEQILKDLHFEPTFNNLFTPGHVNIVFFLPLVLDN